MKDRTARGDSFQPGGRGSLSALASSCSSSAYWISAGGRSTSEFAEGLALGCSAGGAGLVFGGFAGMDALAGKPPGGTSRRTPVVRPGVRTVTTQQVYGRRV